MYTHAYECKKPYVFYREYTYLSHGEVIKSLLPYLVAGNNNGFNKHFTWPVLSVADVEICGKD